MKAFVTGSTGLLGNNLVRELLAAGHEVTALVRSPAKARKMFGDLPITLIQGDMEDIAGFVPALAGHDVLFHTAAYFREYFSSGDDAWAQLERINITHTVALFEQAQALGVSRIIHTSSSGVIDKAHRDETSPPNPVAQSNLYFKSKVLGDRKIAELVERTGAPVISILPGWMLGPGDLAPTASGQFVLDFAHRRLPGWFDGGTCAVDARDVALAMIAAVEHGRIGEKYIIGGEYVSIKTLASTLAELTGLPGPRRGIPTGLLLLAAGGSELYGKLTGKPVLFTRAGVQTMLDKQVVDSAKAIRELGTRFRPLRETLADELRWYAEAGMLPVQVAQSA